MLWLATYLMAAPNGRTVAGEALPGGYIEELMKNECVGELPCVFSGTLQMISLSAMGVPKGRGAIRYYYKLNTKECFPRCSGLPSFSGFQGTIWCWHPWDLFPSRVNWYS